MFPQTLSLPPHFPAGFGDGGSPTRGALCCNGKPYVREESTGQVLCVCQLGSHPALPLPASHVLTTGPLPPRPKSPPSSSSSSSSAATSSLHLPVQVPLPRFTAARGAVGSDLLSGTGVSKECLSTRAIPLGGPYTPAAFAAYHPYLYAGYDVGVRKTAVRETTGPLKAWLHEHRKNPYPTKAEKIMLAIITQMTMTQVSTWFANARRRLKKEGGGGQWEGVGVGDSDTGSRADTPGDTPGDTPNSHKDGSSLGDHYEDLSDVSTEDTEDVPQGPHRSSPSPPDAHPRPHYPHATPDQSRNPYPLQPNPVPYLPTPQHHPSPFPSPFLPPISLSGGLSSTSNSDVIVPNAAPAQAGSGNSRGPGNNPNRSKPRIWSISSIMGLDEAGEKGPEDGRDEGEGGACGGATGSSATWAGAGRVDGSPSSVGSSDCSSGGGGGVPTGNQHGSLPGEDSRVVCGPCPRDLLLYHAKDRSPGHVDVSERFRDIGENHMDLSENRRDVGSKRRDVSERHRDVSERLKIVSEGPRDSSEHVTREGDKEARCGEESDGVDGVSPDSRREPGEASAPYSLR